MIVADNLRITDPVISQAVEKMNPKPVRELVGKCLAAGAQAIDINPGPLTGEPKRKMAFLVETIRELTDLPLLIDTTNPVALEAGLAVDKNAIINAFSLEPEKLERILPLARKYNTDIIGYLLYPNGHVPPDGHERLLVALEVLNALEGAGIDKKQLIIDPIIVPMTWQDGNFQAREVLSVFQKLPELLGFRVRTISALSNLTSGEGPYAEKRLLEKAYLPMLLASGADMIMLNVLHRDLMAVAQMSLMITEPRVFCWGSF